MSTGAIPNAAAASMLLIGSLAHGADWELGGYIGIEPRLFLERPQFPGQTARGLSWSAALAPEFRHEWGDGANRLTIAPYMRVDEHDRERSHADLREASWQHVRGTWTVVAGLSKVFWGVAESRHLVDIVNQTDLVEDIAGEEKLGQPMLRIERWTGRGSFGVFVLPGFRERTFPADGARLRGTLPIAAGVGGFEYTFFGVGGSAVDIGVLAEYLYDGRSAHAPPTIHDDDVFVGVRLMLNDPDGTSLLAGVLVDRNGAGSSAKLEAERRIGAVWTVELEARTFAGVKQTDPLLHGIRNDSFVTLRLARHF